MDSEGHHNDEVTADMGPEGHRMELTNDIKLERKPFNEKGSFGVLHRGRLMSRNEQLVVVKFMRIPESEVQGVIPEEGDDIPQWLNDFYEELSMWSTIDAHPNVLPLMGYYVDWSDDDSGNAKPRSFGLVSRLVLPGDVADNIKANDSSEFRYKIILQAAKGLEHLHAHKPLPIVHGDFRASNLLLERPDEKDENCCVYVADFGIAKLFVENLPSRFTLSTLRPRLNPRWLAPELIEDPYSPRTLQSDVYAFALTAVEVFSLQIPYPNVPDSAIRDHILAGYIPKQPFGVGEDLWTLLRQCWRDRHDRPTMAEVVRGIQSMHAPKLPKRRWVIPRRPHQTESIPL
jgi:serine/threonine protein kinase